MSDCLNSSLKQLIAERYELLIFGLNIYYYYSKQLIKLMEAISRIPKILDTIEHMRKN